MSRPTHYRKRARSGLTLTQERVLRAYALTGNRTEAGDLLGMAPRTVQHHLHGAYVALGVSDGISAFRSRGWLWPPSLDALGPASPVGSSAVSGRAMTRPESEDAA